MVSDAVADVVDYKEEVEDTMSEEVDADKWGDMMEVVDEEANMKEAVGIIQVTGEADRVLEWYSSMVVHRYKCTLTIISHQMSGPGYHSLI